MVIMVILGSGPAFHPGIQGGFRGGEIEGNDQSHCSPVVQRRPGLPKVPLQCLSCPGDIVKLSAGDMIPGDVRVLSAKDLFIIQATLTGESLPSKSSIRVKLAKTSHAGSNVQTCASLAPASRAMAPPQNVVVETGPRTYLGGIASSMSQQLVETNFDKGIKRFTYLMLTFMVVMVPAVFFINALSKSPSVVNYDDLVNLPSLAGKLSAKADPALSLMWLAGWTNRDHSGPRGIPGFHH